MQTSPSEVSRTRGTKSFPGQELWLLAGSQEMYGAETLAHVESQWREVVTALDRSDAIPTRVIARDVMTSAEGILRTCQAANASDECVGVIVWMHTFSPARMWIAGLSALRKPLLHLHTQFNEQLPWAEIDMDFMNLNQSAHGDREFAYMATRLRLRRKTVVGHWLDPVTVERIGTWSRAACGWHESQHLRVARLGDNMRNVAVTEGDKVEAQIRFGVTVDGYGLGDLTDTIAQTPAEDVARILDEYDNEYAMAPELTPTGERRASLVDAAQIEAGLRRFLRAGSYGAFTDTFEDLHGIKQLPGIAAQRLMADGYGFGAEGDWKTASLLRVMKVMARGLPGGTSFMEDYTYHFGPGEPKILGAHMLEVCPSIAAAQPSCEIHPLSIGHREDPVRLVFDAAPGRGIVVGMLDLGDRFRMVANEILLVPADGALPKLPVARAVWKPAPSLATSAECWLTAGGPHHTVLSTAVTRESLDDFANIAGVELVWIDDTTTPTAFSHELQWNAAYQRIERP